MSSFSVFFQLLFVGCLDNCYCPGTHTVPKFIDYKNSKLLQERERFGGWREGLMGSTCI